MTKTLVKTTHDTITQYQALQMINQRNQSNFASVAVAVASLGIAVAATLVSQGTAPVIAATLSAAGISISAGAILEILLGSSYLTKLSNAVSQMRTYSYIIVTTWTYMHMSGSNNWYYTTEHTFAVHHDSN